MKYICHVKWDFPGAMRKTRECFLTKSVPVKLIIMQTRFHSMEFPAVEIVEL